MATTNDIKNGTVLDLDGQLWQVLWFQHHKPGKGNTVVRTKLKHVLSGKIIDKTFNSDTKVESATVDAITSNCVIESDQTGAQWRTLRLRCA